MLHYYVDLRCTGEARLAFEATKCLAALFVHKKFALEWVTSGGVESLLKVQFIRIIHRICDLNYGSDSLIIDQ